MDLIGLPAGATPESLWLQMDVATQRGPIPMFAGGKHQADVTVRVLASPKAR